MRKYLLAAAGAMALVGGATTANAAAVVQAPVGPIPASVADPGSFIIGDNLSAGPGTFSDSFTFTILGTTSALLNGQISSIEGPNTGTHNINFTPGTLLVDGMDVFTKTSSDPSPETWAMLSPITLAPNVTHTIDVAGMLNSQTGAYAGTFNVGPAPVPEAKTWAMMLLGFGAMGLAIRRRRKPVLAQLA